MKGRGTFIASVQFVLVIAGVLAGLLVLSRVRLTRSSAAGQLGETSVHFMSSRQNPQNCTVFYAANDLVALGGNNEDSFNPRTKMWFIPPAPAKHGVAFVGYEDLYPQGGMNDEGLFFDGLAVKVVRVPQEEGKPVYAGNLMVKALQECATVGCVLNLFSQYSRGPGIWNGQYLVGDSAGDSAIIEPLAVIRKQGEYQVATNFFQSEVRLEDRMDLRYRTAGEMLGKAEAFSVDLFRDILQATHQEGEAHTLYSTVYDLRRTTVYLYYFHDYERVVTFDLKTELSRGLHAYDMPGLFPFSDAARAFGEPISQELERRRARLGRAAINPATLAEYEGTYSFTLEQSVVVTREGDKLFARYVYTPWVELLPRSENVFSILYSDGNGEVCQANVVFLRDGVGRVARLEFSDGAGSKSIAVKLEQESFPSAWLEWFTALLVLIVSVIWHARQGRRVN